MKTLNMRLLTVAMTLATTAAGLMAVTREGKEEEKVSIVKTTFAGGTTASGTEGTAMVADGNKWTKWCLLTSSSCHPKILVKEFCYFLMSCHQHCLGINLLVQR